MIFTSTVFVFFIVFAFQFSWMRLKYKLRWSFLNIMASAAICSVLATVVLYAIWGTVLMLLAFALACLMVSVFFLGGTWLMDKVLK